MVNQCASGMDSSAKFIVPSRFLTGAGEIAWADRRIYESCGTTLFVPQCLRGDLSVIVLHWTSDHVSRYGLRCPSQRSVDGTGDGISGRF